MTLFAFDKGQGLSDQTVPFDTLVQVLAGKANFTIGSDTVTAVSGKCVLLPANVTHGVRAVERFRMLLTMLRSKTG